MITSSASNSVPAVSDAEPVDATIVAELRQLDGGGPPTIFRELVAMFSESTPQLLSEACEAVNNPTQLTMIAHTLKGSCSNFGARPMEALCLALEKLGPQGNPGTARGLIDALEKEFFRVRKALELHCV